MYNCIDVKHHPDDFHDMIRKHVADLRISAGGSPSNTGSIIASFPGHPENMLLMPIMRFDMPIGHEVHFKLDMNEGWTESFGKLDDLPPG